MNAGARPPIVLYVEDEPDLASIVADLLEIDGFATAVARHGNQALALLDGGLSPAVIVTDMMMPELDGFGFLAALRARGVPHPPVLAVSAFEPYLRAAGAEGAAATLAKPFEPAQLVGAVRKLMAGERVPPAGPRAPLEDEAARLQAVARLGLDGPAQGGALDEFTVRVARAFDAPVCLVSTIGRDRQFRHAASVPRDPAAAAGSPRERSFCTHAVAARAALVVQDAESNPFFRDNWFVRERGLRFYAGVPLFAQHGEAVGTLCVLDQKPHGFGYFDLELLGTLARRVVAELEAHARGRAAEETPSAVRGAGDWDAAWDVLGRSTFEETLRIEALRAADRGWALAAGAARLDGGVDPSEAVRSLKAALPDGHLGRLGQAQLGFAVPRMDAAALRGALQGAPGVVAVAVEDARRPGGTDALLAKLEAGL